MTVGNGIESSWARAHLSGLVDQLTTGGDLRSPAWRTAFARVPRHVFLPRVFRQLPQPGRYQLIDGTQPEKRDEWLRLVYADETCTTQLDGDATHPQAADYVAEGIVEGIATSSSTMPSLMAAMLEALDVADDTTVLEVGTGTGYNAALLCERLGAHNVTSIDIDAMLLNAARARLSALGHMPTLAVADGVEGYPPDAPYDRVLATCSVTHVPCQWIEQTGCGGVILAALYRELGGGPLVRLTVHADGTARGAFLPTYASFMPIRAHPAPNVLDLLRSVPDAAGDARPSAIDGTVFDQDDFVFFAAHHLPDVGRIQVQDDHGDWQPWLLAPDGSWSYQTIDNHQAPVAVQGGPRRLWDALEHAHQQWLRLGRPSRERFGLTADTTGRHTVWLDRPDSGHAWDLHR